MSFRKRLTFCNVWLKKKILLPSAEEETSSNIQASYNPKQILFRRACALESQLVVPSSKTCSHSRPQVIFLVKFPSIAVVIARGLAVPTPGIAGPLVSRKLLRGSQNNCNYFLPLYPYCLWGICPGGQEAWHLCPGVWASITDLHIWSCLQHALTLFHPTLLQTVAAQRGLTALDTWLLECFMT